MNARQVSLMFYSSVFGLPLLIVAFGARGMVAAAIASRPAAWQTLPHIDEMKLLD